MRASLQMLLLAGLIVLSIAASQLWAGSSDHRLLSPAPMTAPPQIQAEPSPRPTPTPLPRNSRDRGPAPLQAATHR
jgi:hypothetical protein